MPGRRALTRTKDLASGPRFRIWQLRAACRRPLTDVPTGPACAWDQSAHDGGSWWPVVAGEPAGQ